MSVKIGDAQFFGEFKKKNHFKLKDGESVGYRILPPLFELADEGRWSFFWNAHFGYRSPTTKKVIPFQSPQVKNRQTKTIEVRDAALDRLTTLKEKMEAAKKSGNTQVFQMLDQLVGSGKGGYNIDNNHHMNVIDENGNIGELKIRHRAKVALDLLISQLRASGVNPLSMDNGRFFVFRRSGIGIDTTFQVSVRKKKFRVEGVGEVEQDVVHAITPDIISRLKTEAFDLNKLFRTPTSAEVEAIVNESDLKTGFSPALDRIFPKKSRRELDPNFAGDDGAEDEELGTTPPETTTATVTPLVTPVVVTNAASTPTPQTIVTVAETKEAPAATAAKPAPSDDETYKAFLASLDL